MLPVKFIKSNSLSCILGLFWQINYTQNTSAGRWRESVTTTVQRVQKEHLLTQPDELINKRFSFKA